MKNFLIFLVFCCTFSFFNNTLAQENAPSLSTPTPSPTVSEEDNHTIDFSDELLESYLRVYEEIEALELAMVSELEAVAHPIKQIDILKRTKEQMINVIEQSETITLEQFNVIHEAQRTDPALAEKLEALSSNDTVPDKE